MKYFIVIVSIFLVFCINAFAKEKRIVLHPPCEGQFRPDTLSKHKYQSRSYKHLFASGYCVEVL